MSYNLKWIINGKYILSNYVWFESLGFFWLYILKFNYESNNIGDRFW